MSKISTLIDTNVLVSGLISSNGYTATIVNWMLTKRIIFLLSPDVIKEYREVILWPKIKARHQLHHEEVDIILTDIIANGLIRHPEHSSEKAPNSYDQHLWNLLATQPRSCLITGDKELIKTPPSFSSVISPKEFVDLK